MKHLSGKPLKHAKKVVNKTYNNEFMMRLLTCRSLMLVLGKDQDEQATNALARLDVLPPVVSSFNFIIFFVCKVMPYFTSTVLFIRLFRAR